MEFIVCSKVCVGLCFPPNTDSVPSRHFCAKPD